MLLFFSLWVLSSGKITCPSQGINYPLSQQPTVDIISLNNNFCSWGIFLQKRKRMKFLVAGDLKDLLCYYTVFTIAIPSSNSQCANGTCEKKSLSLKPDTRRIFFWMGMFLRLWTSRSGRNVSTSAWESASVFRSTLTRSTRPKTANWTMPAQNWRQTHWKPRKESVTTNQSGLTTTRM